MKLLTRLLGLWVLTSFILSAHAGSIQDHAFTNLDHPQVKPLMDDIDGHLNEGQFDQVVAKGEDVQVWLAKSNLPRTVQAYYLNNLSIALARAGETNQALVTSQQAVELLEGLTPFHPDLYHVMMAKGYILVYEGAFDEAEDALRHAQHIAHRNQGVYAKDQLPTLRLLTDVLANTGKDRDADQTQRFFLKVNEQIYGAASEEMIPSLAEVGNYFANRGRGIPSGQARTQTVYTVGRNRSIELSQPEADITYRSRLFREAEIAFERSIAIIEGKYGSTDLRLVEPLKGLSKTKFLEGYARSYAEAPMEKMVAIVHQNPGSDVADKARALVELGDLYIKTEDARAEETYKKAWDLLSDPEHDDLRYSLFGRPVRLLPEYNFRPTLPRYPVDLEPDQQLYVDLTYNVLANGRVRQVHVVDSNIPLRNQKQTRTGVKYMKFRPRMVDGELVDTNDLSLHQTFTVLRPEPVFESNISVNP
ncbi:MAG: tetratricopeptide repeat protein [Pseudomonadales bacterium]